MEMLKRYVWALVALWMTMMYAWELTKSDHYLDMALHNYNLVEMCMSDLRGLHVMSQRWMR